MGSQGYRLLVLRAANLATKEDIAYVHYRGTHFKDNEGFEANWMYVVRGI